MIVDADGVIVLDSSSSSDEGDSQPQVARKSAPAAAAAAASAYDSDEHAQFLVREIMSSGDSSSGGGDDSDAYDDDVAFEGARAFANKRKRAAVPARKPAKAASTGKQDPRSAKKKKQTVKRARYVSADDASESDNDDDSSSNSLRRRRKRERRRSRRKDGSSDESEADESDSYASRSQSRPKAVAARKQVLQRTPSVMKTQWKSAKAPPLTPPARPSHAPEYIDMLSESEAESLESEEDRTRHRKQQQRTADKKSHRSKRSNSHSSLSSVEHSSRHAVVTEPQQLLRKNGTPTTSSVSYNRTDHAFHQLTEKLSFSELQAQRRELEQLRLMHKRAGAGGGGATSSAPSASVAHKPPRLESRKSVTLKSRVDEIEKRVKSASKVLRETPSLTIDSSSREVVIPTSRPPASISSSIASDKVIRSSTNTTITAIGFTGALRSLDSDRNRIPVVHNTAWRRLQFMRAPPNILSPEAEHLAPFSDEFDRPLPDFDPTGELEKKTRILSSFGQTLKTTEASYSPDSFTQEDMNEKVQELISEALPLLQECHKRRVRTILRGTREQLRSYFHEYRQRHTQLQRSGIPHQTFDLTYSERSDARRLSQARRLRAPKLNSMVGQVRYFVSHNASKADPEVVVEGDAEAEAVVAFEATEVTKEQVVYPETVIQLSDDIPPLRKSWAYIGVRKNVHVADDPILRYIPYLGENTRVNIDPNRYSSTTMDKSKRVELIGSQKGSVLELKSVVTSALDDELMEYLLRFVVCECGDSKKVYEALQRSGKFSQPYSDYCEIKKNDDAGRRLVRRITSMQSLMSGASDVQNIEECAGKIREYLQALGSSCWFLQPRVKREGLSNRLKPPIPFFESNYRRFPRGGGLRRTKVYNDSTEWFRDLFCRRCYTYDCDEHGIMQPTPLRRTDPINPVVRKAGLALRDNPTGVVVDMVEADMSSTADGVIELSDSSSDEEEKENAEQVKMPSASASASDDESSARRRSRRSQTRISSLASASLKIQEKMQEKERRRQRRIEAKEFRQLTRAGDDFSEYLDDSHMNTVMEVVQSLLSKETTCSPDCWKKRKSSEFAAASSAVKPSAESITVAEGANPTTAAATAEVADPGSDAAESTSLRVPAGDAAAVGESVIAEANADGSSKNPKQSIESVSPTPAAPASITAARTAPRPVHTFNDAEVLLIRKLSSTIGDNSCLIAAMLRSASCTCEKISQFLELEQKTRWSKSGEDNDGYRRRSSSADMPNRRRQKSDRHNQDYSFSGNRELLRHTRAHRHHDKGNKHSYQPCNHDGICDGCECMKRDHHCNKACSCPRDCPNRFQGCKCSLGNCRTKACPCYSAGRECDPDYCFWCGASDAAVMVIGTNPERRLNYDIGICCNANLLRGAQRKIGISFSTTHGWGAFALEPIRKGEFLYEYTGALISDDEAERRGSIYDVMAISFLFDVNCDEVVDATRKGNKSKFANHKALESANCEAKILLVNGEHRIALYARDDIAVGEELFFDYGYTHETAPKWSKVEIRRGQRFEVNQHQDDQEMDLLQDFGDDDDDDDDAFDSD